MAAGAFPGDEGRLRQIEMAVFALAFGFRHPGVAMYLGDPVCADHGIPAATRKTFHRIVDRYSGDYRTRSLSCAEQFASWPLRKLTYRESLRDISSVSGGSSR